MKRILFKITLYFSLIIEFIKSFSESQIQFLVDHSQSSGLTGLPQYADDYHRMPFSSFGLNPTNPSFTISGTLYASIGSTYQIFFQIYDNNYHDKKLVMFGFDELLSPKAIFIRQQYAANSYSGEILCPNYSAISNLHSQFIISLRKSATQIDIDFTLTKGSAVICSQSSTITSNILDWNADYTVQFSDSGVSVPNGQRAEYSSSGGVSRVFLIRDIYIKFYGEVAKYFVKRLLLHSQEGINIINKFNQIPSIQDKCVPDESILRASCAQSTKNNQLPKIDKGIASFSSGTDIIFKYLCFYQFYYHYTKFAAPGFATYSFWLNLDSINLNDSIQLFSQTDSVSSIYVILLYDSNGYKIQFKSIYSGSTQTWNSPLILSLKKFYYLMFSYYNYNTFDLRIIIIDDAGVLSEYFYTGANVNLFTLNSLNFQVGSDQNTMNSFFQLSQFQMNLSSAILYDELNYPQVVDSLNIIANCQIVILIRLKYQCLVCKLGFYLFENTCKNSCNSGYTPNQSIRTCIRVCSYRCETCELNDPNKCITCSSPDRDILVNCSCKQGYEDQISADCSKFKAQNQFNSDMEISYFGSNSNSLNFQSTRIFNKPFKKVPFVIILIDRFININSYLKGIQTKIVNLSKESVKIDVQTSQGVANQPTDFTTQILAFCMDPKKYFSKQLDFNTPISDVYQQNIDIGQYDSSIYGDYQVLTFLSGIMMGQDTSYSSCFADFRIDVINNKQKIQVTVNSYVKSVQVTYLVLPTSIQSLFQSFTFQAGTFYYDTNNKFISKVHSNTMSITNNQMLQKKFLFTPFFSLTSLGILVKLSYFRISYKYAPQNDLDKQYSRQETDSYQCSQYSTNGFYFIEQFNQQFDKCTVKDYYTQEGCYKCKFLYGNEADNCDSCFGNRVLKQLSCDCPDTDFQKVYTDEINCSYKETAVLNVQLSTDFSLITIEFGLAIEPISFQLLFDSSNELCQHLFQQDTLDKIQKSSNCLISGSILLIYLGKMGKLKQVF